MTGLGVGGLTVVVGGVEGLSAVCGGVRGLTEVCGGIGEKVITPPGDVFPFSSTSAAIRAALDRSKWMERR